MIGQDGPNPSRFKRSFIWDGSFICVLKQLKLVDMWTSFKQIKVKSTFILNRNMQNAVSETIIDIASLEDPL